MSERERQFINVALYKATRELLWTDFVILHHRQVLRMTPELVLPSPNYHTNGRTISLDRFNVHRPPLQERSSMAQGLEPGTLRFQVSNYDHCVNVATKLEKETKR
ncbi:hypothetical protein TNCV_3562091 [Trichonephila clavipes]|nr:hypothetical protein TNCV_3562091 [Trichonephila clavipes]